MVITQQMYRFFTCPGGYSSISSSNQPVVMVHQLMYHLRYGFAQLLVVVVMIVLLQAIGYRHSYHVYGDSIRTNTPNNSGNGQAGTGVAWRVSQFTRSCTNHMFDATIH